MKFVNNKNMYIFITTPSPNTEPPGEEGVGVVDLGRPMGTFVVAGNCVSV